MNTEFHEEKNIKLKDLVSFRFHSSITYEGDRLEQLMDSIERNGLIVPIIVRPIADDKYEIICGHNRVKATKALGRDTIMADVRNCLSDDEATELYYDSNLNQQSFSDWSYSQKIEAIKYYDTLIKNTSHQGKRNDLIEKIDAEAEDETCVYTRHKLDKKSKRSTSRDKMARCLGISTATFSKYRRIIKLPNDIVDLLGELLDNKKITFEAAYLISALEDEQIKDILQFAVTHKEDKQIDIDKLRSFSKKIKPGYVRPRIDISDLFASRKKGTGMLSVRF